MSFDCGLFEMEKVAAKLVLIAKRFVFFLLKTIAAIIVFYLAMYFTASLTLNPSAEREMFVQDEVLIYKKPTRK